MGGTVTDMQKPETNLQTAGYTYKAENYCLHHALTNLERNMNHPLFDVHALEAVIDEEEQILAIAAEHMEIDHLNPYSYDSDVFPKPFTKEDVRPNEACPDCLVRFSDGVQVLPWTVFGIEMEDGRQIYTHIMAGHFGQMVGPCFTEEEDGIKRWVGQVTAAGQEEALRLIEGLEYTEEPE